MRKPDFCLCKTDKGADQLCSNCAYPAPLFSYRLFCVRPGRKNEARFSRVTVHLYFLKVKQTLEKVTRYGSV